MSIDATRWAWRLRIPDVDGVKKSSIKLVLLALADRASEDHEAWPSAMRLHVDTDLDRKTILDAIAALIELGLVTDTGKRRGNGVRVLRLEGVDDRIGTHPENGTGSKSNPSLKRDATSTENGTGTSTENGTQNQPGNLKGTLSAQARAEGGFSTEERPAGQSVPASSSRHPAVVAERNARPPEPVQEYPPEVSAEHIAKARRALGMRTQEETP